MVIIQNKSGQLANRLFLFSHFIANAIENEYFLINPTFDEYCQYFYATRSNDFGSYFIYTRFPINIPFILFKICFYLAVKIFPISRWHEFVECSTDEEISLSNTNFLNKFKTKITIVNGWLFRDNKNFLKHSDIIRSFFTPDTEVLEAINQLILDCRNRCEIIVGVHIRRGDYKLWENGKYYFNDDVYINKMNQLEKCFNLIGKRVLFLICSNEPIEIDNFREKNIQLGIGLIIEDLYSLAQCDYLIGPPSTYSMWASFYGKVPLLHIREKSQILKLENFTIVT
ncbi:alpha-1,2-fucosyltransferase [Pseudanabaena mucicola]|uniref:Alpha-1,2-fucosyltransferase n=1 Tax=Pseudanabaena mucicola FACHB-723 TaxID=2692860 RepID=A0ABR7ZYQ4_9CYAN|nr:alpha-1,2-fucosyltransferase [Pseudanabaena mucicola]MBD2188610.1 alpha-1,2-fucosyltransferase [Pseudanabaena mucicola FACHB-723]